MDIWRYKLWQPKSSAPALNMGYQPLQLRTSTNHTSKTCTRLTPDCVTRGQEVMERYICRAYHSIPGVWSDAIREWTSPDLHLQLLLTQIPVQQYQHIILLGGWVPFKLCRGRQEKSCLVLELVTGHAFLERGHCLSC